MKHLATLATLLVAVTLCGTASGQGSDECATAQQFILNSGGTTSLPVDNTTATDSVPALPVVGCPGGVGGFGDMAIDVWFEFIAPADGVVDVSTCTGTLDTDIIVYQGDSLNCGALVEEACNGDISGTVFCSDLVGVPVIGGSSYLIRVGGWNALQVGTTTLDVTHFGANPAVGLTCTENGNSQAPAANLTFTLPAPIGGAPNFDDVNIYVDGTLTLSLGPLGPGPQTVPGLAIPNGNADVCVETVLGGSASPQVCCSTFVPPACPTSSSPALSPIATLAPFIANVNCNNQVNSVENSYYRTYDLINQYGVNDDITPTCFSMLVSGVTSPTGTSVPVRIRLHYDTNGGAPDNLADLILFYEEEFQVPVLANETYNFVFGSGVVDPDGAGLNPTPNVGCLASVSPGATLVVEVFQPDYNLTNLGNFFTGSVPAAAGSPISRVFIRAPMCGFLQPVQMSSIQADALIPMDLTYDIQVPGACSAVGGVANLNCNQAPGTTDVDLTWSISGTTGSFVIDVFGVPVGTVSGTTTAFTVPALTPFQTSNISVTAFTGAGGTGSVISSRSCNVNVAPENSWLVGATPLIASSIPFDITTSVVTQGLALDVLDCDMDQGGLLGGGEQIFNDLYYSFTPAFSGEVLVSTCGGTTGDTRLAVYLGNSNASADVIACNDDRIVGGQTPGGTADNVYNPSCTNFAAELTFQATAGMPVTIRLGTSNPAVLFTNGELTINDCVPVTNLDSTLDCTNGDVTLTWDNNPAAATIDVLRNGVLIAASLPLGTTTYTDLAAPDGDHAMAAL